MPLKYRHISSRALKAVELISIKVFPWLVLQNFASAFLQDFCRPIVQTRHHRQYRLKPTRLLRAEAFAWLGTTLLLLNLVTAAVMPPNIASAAALAGSIEICTSEGMVWVDASGHRLKQDGVPTQGASCQFCMPLLHAAFAPPMPTELPMPRDSVLLGAVGIPSIHLAVRVAHPTAQPRAPPSV